MLRSLGNLRQILDTFAFSDEVQQYARKAALAVAEIQGINISHPLMKALAQNGTFPAMDYAAMVDTLLVEMRRQLLEAHEICHARNDDSKSVSASSLAASQLQAHIRIRCRFALWMRAKGLNESGGLALKSPREGEREAGDPYHTPSIESVNSGEVHGDVNALLRSGLADMSEAETAKVMLGRVGHDRLHEAVTVLGLTRYSVEDMNSFVNLLADFIHLEFDDEVSEQDNDFYQSSHGGNVSKTVRNFTIVEPLASRHYNVVPAKALIDSPWSPTCQEILLASDTNRLVAELTFVRINDLAAPVEKMSFLMYLEPFVAILIVANGIMIGFQTDPEYADWPGQIDPTYGEFFDCAGVKAQHKNRIAWEATRDLETKGCSFSQYPAGFIYFEAVFGVFLVLEILLRMRILRCRKYWCGPDRYWNWFDLVLGATGVADLAIQLLTQGGGVEGTSLLRFCRLIRLVRIVKVFRIKAGNVFSDRTLALAFMLLFGVLYVISGFATIAIGENDMAKREDLAKYFENIPISMFTAFRCFTGECVNNEGKPIHSILFDYLGWPFIFSYIASYMLVTMGIFNVILAVYVDITMKAAKDTNDAQTAEQHSRESVRVARCTRELLKKFAGAYHTGTLQITELLHGLLKIRGDISKSDTIASYLATKAVQNMMIEHKEAAAKEFAQFQQQFFQTLQIMDMKINALSADQNAPNGRSGDQSGELDMEALLEKFTTFESDQRSMLASVDYELCHGLKLPVKPSESQKDHVAQANEGSPAMEEVQLKELFTAEQEAQQVKRPKGRRNSKAKAETKPRRSRVKPNEAPDADDDDEDPDPGDEEDPGAEEPPAERPKKRRTSLKGRAGRRTSDAKAGRQSKELKEVKDATGGSVSETQANESHGHWQLPNPAHHRVAPTPTERGPSSASCASSETGSPLIAAAPEPKEDALPKVPATPKPSAVGRSLAETSVWRWNQLGLEACGGQKTHERCPVKPPNSARGRAAPRPSAPSASAANPPKNVPKSAPSRKAKAQQVQPATPATPPAPEKATAATTASASRAPESVPSFARQEAPSGAWTDQGEHRPLELEAGISEAKAPHDRHIPQASKDDASARYLLGNQVDAGGVAAEVPLVRPSTVNQVNINKPQQERRPSTSEPRARGAPRKRVSWAPLMRADTAKEEKLQPMTPMVARVQNQPRQTLPRYGSRRWPDEDFVLEMNDETEEDRREIRQPFPTCVDELEPINYFQLVDGQSTNKKPSKCFQKSDLKTRAGLSICPAKMTRFGCACDGC
eukprot:g26898.t1